MMTAAMVSALDFKLLGHPDQVINSPVAWIVAHGVEQLGPFIHRINSMLFDTATLLSPRRFDRTGLNKKCGQDPQKTSYG